jgi:hypothetical protein
MKFKVTETTTKEYDVDLANYPEGTTENQALILEQEAAEDDPFLYIEGGDTKIVVERIG